MSRVDTGAENDRLDRFVTELRIQLEKRYYACEDFSATPSSILRDTLDAIAAAEEHMRQTPTVPAKRTLLFCLELGLLLLGAAVLWVIFVGHFF